MRSTKNKLKTILYKFRKLKKFNIHFGYQSIPTYHEDSKKLISEINKFYSYTFRWIAIYDNQFHKSKNY